MLPQASVSVTKNIPDYSTFLLHQLLADQYILSLQALRCHWWFQQTVPDGMHSYLEWQFDRLNDLMDMLISRMAPAGEISLEDAGQLLRFARLADPENDEDAEYDPEVLVQLLRSGHEELVQHINEDIALFNWGEDTLPTRELLEYMREHHIFMAWLIRFYAS